MSIESTLRPLSFPVLHTPKPEAVTEKRYLVYRTLGQTSTLYAEGREVCYATIFALDFYSDHYPWADIALIRALLTAAGYLCTVEEETYEDSVDLYHVALTVHSEREEFV